MSSYTLDEIVIKEATEIVVAWIQNQKKSVKQQDIVRLLEGVIAKFQPQCKFKTREEMLEFIKGVKEKK